MTAKRDFKRVVRERMAKTGETYTQAPFTEYSDDQRLREVVDMRG